MVGKEMGQGWGRPVGLGRPRPSPSEEGAPPTRKTIGYSCPAGKGGSAPRSGRAPRRAQRLVVRAPKATSHPTFPGKSSGDTPREAPS